jgi:hypothetical protein
VCTTARRTPPSFFIAVAQRVPAFSIRNSTVIPDADAAVVVGLNPDSVGSVFTILGWSKIPTKQKWATRKHDMTIFHVLTSLDEPGRAGCSPKRLTVRYWGLSQVHFVMRLPLNYWIEGPFYLACPWLYIMYRGGNGAYQGPTRTLGVSETRSWKQNLDLNTPKNLQLEKSII